MQIAPHNRRILRVTSEGRTYQFKVIPFGLALTLRTFTKCVKVTLSPLRQSRIYVLNYLDDWPVIAQLRDVLENHKFQLLEHLKLLGLKINVQKSSLRPMQDITFWGMNLDSQSMRASLSGMNTVLGQHSQCSEWWFWSAFRDCWGLWKQQRWCASLGFCIWDHFNYGKNPNLPSRPNMLPLWDLSLLLSALSEPPYEPLHTAELKCALIQDGTFTRFSMW